MSVTTDFSLSPLLTKRAVEDALAEDLGVRGDLTTDATVPRGTMSAATFGARRPGVIAGLAVAEAAFHALDPSVVFEPLVADGARVDAGAVVARV